MHAPIQVANTATIVPPFLQVWRVLPVWLLTRAFVAGHGDFVDLLLVCRKWVVFGRPDPNLQLSFARLCLQHIWLEEEAILRLNALEVTFSGELSFTTEWVFTDRLIYAFFHLSVGAGCVGHCKVVETITFFQ